MLNSVSPLRLTPPQQYKANSGLSPNATQQREGVKFPKDTKSVLQEAGHVMSVANKEDFPASFEALVYQVKKSIAHPSGQIEGEVSTQIGSTARLSEIKVTFRNPHVEPPTKEVVSFYADASSETIAGRFKGIPEYLQKQQYEAIVGKHVTPDAKVAVESILEGFENS